MNIDWYSLSLLANSLPPSPNNTLLHSLNEEELDAFTMFCVRNEQVDARGQFAILWKVSNAIAPSIAGFQPADLPDVYSTIVAAIERTASHDLLLFLNESPISLEEIIKHEAVAVAQIGPFLERATDSGTERSVLEHHTAILLSTEMRANIPILNSLTAYDGSGIRFSFSNTEHEWPEIIRDVVNPTEPTYFSNELRIAAINFTQSQSKAAVPDFPPWVLQILEKDSKEAHSLSFEVTHESP